MSRNPERYAAKVEGAPLYHIELVRDAAVKAETPPVRVNTPEDVATLCSDMADTDREHFDALLLNTKNRIIVRVNVSIGSLNASIVHPREVFGPAVVCKAASVVLVHNHPSGDPTPSGADIQLTRRLAKAGDVLGIEVLDHVVVGRDPQTLALNWNSLRDYGAL